MGHIQATLQALADTVRSFRQDAVLEVCLAKCTIYMPGIQIERAHNLIRDCFDSDMSGKLETLRPMIAQSLDVIQVNGLCVVGTPVGPKDYVREYVRNSVAQVALKEFTFGVRHDEVLDDTFLCISIVIQEKG